MQFQRCPNCRERNDVSVYVHGQLARCARCGLRFAVDREALASNPNEPKSPAPPAGGKPDVQTLVSGAPETPSEVPELVPLPESGPPPPPVPSDAGSEPPRPPAPKQVVKSEQILTPNERPPGPRPPPPVDFAQPPVRPELPGYDCLELLGRGGMGEVWRARQHSLNRIVAIKILSPSLAVEPDFVRRFERESSALAAISHPNIVTVYDRGSANGVWYFVMEFVEGRSLRDRMDARPPRAEMLRLFTQVARAVDHAHRRGVIHRDLKPENVLLDHMDNAKVADFGLAGMSEVGRSSLTMTAVAMGTAHYMAPEQRRDAKNVDGRADLYSMGVMLYELFLHEIPAGKFPTPKEKIPDLDPRLDTLVMSMLDQDPEKRPARASDVIEILDACQSSPPPPVEIAPAPSSALPPKPLDSLVQRVRQQPAQRAALVAALLFLVFVMGVAMSRVGGSGGRLLAARLDPQNDKTVTLAFGVGPQDGILTGADGWLTHEGSLVRSEEEPAAGKEDPRAYVQRLALDFDNARIEADVEIEGKGTAKEPAFAELALTHDERQVSVRLPVGSQTPPLLSTASGKTKEVPGSTHDPLAESHRYHVALFVLNGSVTAKIDGKVVANTTVPGPSGQRARAGFGCQVGRCQFSEVRISGVVADTAIAAAPQE
jgi:serine/threonine protein kinase